MSTEYPGPLCKAAGITSAFLITLADQPDVRTVISPDIITNGLIVELEFFRKETTKSCDVLRTWITVMTGMQIDCRPTVRAFKYAVTKVMQERQRLLKKILCNSTTRFFTANFSNS